jgi:hypothetical protein
MDAAHMISDQLICGEVSQYDEPDWEPLRDLVGMELADWFMWMFEIELAGRAIVHVYKHIATRRCVHLAVDGRVFVYMPGGFYRQTDPRRAIDLVFARWDEHLTERDDPVAIGRALERARRAAAARASQRPRQDEGGGRPPG